MAVHRRLYQLRVFVYSGGDYGGSPASISDAQSTPTAAATMLVRRLHRQLHVFAYLCGSMAAVAALAVQLFQHQL